jgi:hypothetical protein
LRAAILFPGDLQLKKAKLPTMRNTVVQLQRLARERADEQARRIPWQRLLDTRNQYIDWQEFYLWARSILEVEEQIPTWLVDILKERCPGFLEPGRILFTAWGCQAASAGSQEDVMPPNSRCGTLSCLIRYVNVFASYHFQFKRAVL